MPAAAVIPAQAAPYDKKPDKKTNRQDKEAMEGSNEPQDGAGINGQLNSPQVDATGKPTQRAITTAKQAWTIAKNMRDRAKEHRIKKAGKIADKYNAEPPYSPEEIKASGQSWRHNYSTNFLGSIVDRVVPQMTDPVNEADRLTHSMLPADETLYPDSAEKSRIFQQKITDCIRRWPKWKDLMSGIAKEVVLYGNAAPCCIDSDWRPRLWGFGECFLPEGTKQHSTDVQIIALYQPILLHDFINLFDDPALAKLGNYNVPDCVKIANKTTGTQQNTTDPTALDVSNAVRDGGSGLLGWSFDNPTKTVNLFYVLVRDYTGEVDIWVVAADDGAEVRHELGVKPGIADATALFTFQSGNRDFYGSKGLGRLEANLHTAIERGRCLGSDQQFLSGLVLFEGDPKDASAVQSKVRYPFCIVKGGKALIETKVEFDFESFDQMDRKLVEIAESIAGAFIPPNLEGGGSSKTKIEAAEKSARDQAVREGVLGRFFDHLGELVGMMQRGICNPDNLREANRIFTLKKKQQQTGGARTILRKVFEWLKKAKIALTGLEPAPMVVYADDDAVATLVEIMQAGLSPEEIVTAALQPAGANSNNEGADKDNATIQYIANNRQNPYVDQQKASVMDAKLQIGEDRANEIIIPQDDPAIVGKAQRDQIIEFSEMVDGNAMPVIKTDYHVVHRETLSKPLGNLIQVIEQQPTVALVSTAQLALQHYSDHIHMDTISSPDTLKQELGVMQQWSQVVNKALAMLQQQQQAAQATGAPQLPDGAPAPAGTPGATPPAAPPMDPETQIKAFSALAEVEARKRDQELEQERLELDTAKHNHETLQDAVGAQQTNLGILQKAKDSTDAQAGAEADRLLQQQAQTANQEAQGNNP